VVRSGSPAPRRYPEARRLGILLSPGGIRLGWAVVNTSCPYTVRSDDTLKVRFSPTVAEKPEIELTCVMVPLCTENWLRFSARLGYTLCARYPPGSEKASGSLMTGRILFTGIGTTKIG
jgi:hypothetical protein